MPRKTTTTCALTHPYLTSFVHGAFSANSGGSVESAVQFLKKYVNEFDYDAAEEELRNYCDEVKMAHWLGQRADDGYTTLAMNAETDERETMLAYKILDAAY